MTRPLLHDYFRSSAAYRVRIALRVKGVEHDSVSVDLRTSEQSREDYRALNPQGFVPMLEIDGHRIAQSLAIIDYLEATRPDPALLPRDPAHQAHVRAMALTVACDVHPLNNLRVLRYLEHELGQDESTRNRWYAHWIAQGLGALEQMAAPRAGRFLFGDSPTLADICLVPQLYNARRFAVPLDAYPTLLRADEQAARLEPFAAAHPDRVQSQTA
jgi:maleylacetoacetate isomerase